MLGSRRSGSVMGLTGVLTLLRSANSSQNKFLAKTRLQSEKTKVLKFFKNDTLLQCILPENHVN